MSHIQTCDVELRDLEAVKTACERLGWSLVKGQKTFKWFGVWVGDTEAPRHLFHDEKAYRNFQAMSPESQRASMTSRMSWCDHAIKVPGADYEIGLQWDGACYRPVWDYYETGGLAEHMGTDGGKLAQAYAVEYAKRWAWSQGYSIEEQSLADGTVEISMTGGGL